MITSMGLYIFWWSHRWVRTVFDHHIDGFCTVFHDHIDGFYIFGTFFDYYIDGFCTVFDDHIDGLCTVCDDHIDGLCTVFHDHIDGWSIFIIPFRSRVVESWIGGERSSKDVTTDGLCYTPVSSAYHAVESKMTDAFWDGRQAACLLRGFRGDEDAF